MMGQRGELFWPIIHGPENRGNRVLFIHANVGPAPLLTPILIMNIHLQCIQQSNRPHRLSQTAFSQTFGNTPIRKTDNQPHITPKSNESIALLDKMLPLL